MPTYQYECSGCGHAFEKMQSITEAKLTVCPSCKKSTLHRLIGTGSGLIFKGSGFYQTDYKNKPCSPNTCPVQKDSGGCCADSGNCQH
ncbi:MAG TPA: zinc ribbon domain-containing protein [Candidatus Omnitrophota bacterium]|jgi:putative FmdB family regulatory protein|nr:zinc ribbon domain-containing protein [Candidatus Omnitrophota bacterium]